MKGSYVWTFESEQKISNYVIAIFFILWFSFLLILAFRQSYINGIESTDSYFYLKLAESSFMGDSYTHRIYSPGYSWIVSLLLNFGIDLEMSGRFVSILFSLLSVFISFLSLRKFFGDASAFFGTLSIMSIPQYIYYSVSTLPYTTATFFFWSVFYLSFFSRNLFLALLAGLICGYGYVVRPEIILAIPLYIIISRNFKSFILLLLGFFLSSLPYHIVSIQEGNLPSILSKFVSYRISGVGVSLQEILEKSEYVSEKAFELKSYIRYFISNIHLSHKYAIPNLISPVSIILFGLGLGAVLRYWGLLRHGMKPFFLLLLVWILPLFSLVIVADYMFVQILITFGAVCGNALRLLDFRKISLILFFSVLLNTFWASRPFYSDDGKKIYKIAGDWIKQNIGSKKIIFENSPFTSFYADGVWTPSPKNSDLVVITSIDFTYPRNLPLIQLFLSEQSEDFELIQKIQYRSVVAKIFKSKINKR